MSAKSDAYAKDLGNTQFRNHYDDIAWNSRIPVITEAENMPKKSVSEVGLGVSMAEKLASWKYEQRHDPEFIKDFCNFIKMRGAKSV